MTDVGHALTAGHFTTSTVSDFICDPDEGFQGNHVFPFKRYQNASTSLRMLYIC